MCLNENVDLQWIDNENILTDLICVGLLNEHTSHALTYCP